MIRKTIHDKILSTPQFTWFDIIKFKRLEKPHKVLETTTMNNKNKILKTKNTKIKHTTVYVVWHTTSIHKLKEITIL